MNLKDLLTESKTLDDFINRWILFLWNNRKIKADAVEESIVVKNEKTFIRYSQTMKSKIEDSLKDTKLINELLATAEKIESAHISIPKDFSQMNDTEFFTWAQDFFMHVLEAFNRLNLSYGSMHMRGKIYYGIDYDLLVSRIEQINKLYSFCRTTLLEEIATDSKIFTLYGSHGGHNLFIKDMSIRVKPNNETLGDEAIQEQYYYDKYEKEEIIIEEEL